jgi:hypothetical protein
VPTPYTEVTIDKSISWTEKEVLKRGLIGLAAKSEQDIVRIQVRR